MADSLNSSHNYYDDDENIINWETEAAAIIRDVQAHVKQIFVSDALKSNNFEIFINVKTLEDEKYCIRASVTGFQIAGKDFDKTDQLGDDNIEEIFFETPYALLISISAGYMHSFASRLSQQLRDTLT